MLDPDHTSTPRSTSNFPFTRRAELTIIITQVSAGGIPGWVTALNASMRVNDPAFEAAWKPYWKVVGEMFAKNQVSEGGPIILVQIENGQ